MIVKIKNNFAKIIMATSTLIILNGCMPVLFTGAASSVFTLAKDRSAADALVDIKISNLIKASFIKKNFRELYAKIKIEVFMKRVLLTGTVDKEEDVVTAIESAWQKDVVEVVNELKVDKNSNTFDLVQYTRDTLITSQIKSKTFLNHDIKFGNFTVVTVNDIVYLFGIARSKEELEKVAEIASNIHGVEKVISHVRIVPELAPAKKEEDELSASDNTNDYSSDTLVEDESDDVIKY